VGSLKQEKVKIKSCVVVILRLFSQKENKNKVIIIFNISPPPLNFPLDKGLIKNKNKCNRKNLEVRL